MLFLFILLLILLFINKTYSNIDDIITYSPLYHSQISQKQQQQQQSIQQPQQQQQQQQQQPILQQKHKIIPRPELDDIDSLPYLSNPTIYQNSVNLNQPIKIVSFNGKLNVDLTIKSYRYDNGFIAFNTRIYCYLEYCSIPGPSLVSKPGDIIEVKITNELETNDKDSLFVNSTNFFIHGLHIDPKTNNFTKSISGNGNFEIYKFQIPDDHSPGNHWYHSHQHGTSALHVMGGLIGSIIVSPIDDTDLPKSISSMTRIELIFSHINLDDNKTIVNLADGPSDIYSYQRLAQKLNSKLPINPSFQDDKIRDIWLTNGQYQPTYTMRPGEWQIFDMLAASGDRILEIEIRTAIGASNGDYACEINLLAIDGIYLDKTRTGNLAKHIVLVQGSRASVAVKCINNGTYYLQSASSMDPSSSYWRIGELDTKSSQNLLILNIQGSQIQDGESGSVAPDEDLSTIPKPSYLKASTKANETSWSISTDQTKCTLDIKTKYWMGVGTDCNLACFNKTDCTRLFGDSYCVNSLPSVITKKCSYDYFDGNTHHSSILGNSEILNIWSRSGMSSQSFHLPVNSFQYLSHDDEEGHNIGSFYSLSGDWRDTWPMLKGKSVIRTFFSDFLGQRVLHNNYLNYEDDGLLSSIDIIPVPSSPVQSPPPIIVPTTVITPNVIASEITNTGVLQDDPKVDMLHLNTMHYDHCDVDGKSFYYSETIDIRNRVRTIVSNACPNHFSACQKEECSGEQSSLAKPHNITISIPLFPEFSLNIKDTTCTTDAIAIALNGVPIKGPSDGSIKCMEPSVVQNVTYGKQLCSLHGINDGIQYCGDAVNSGSEFDKCGGYSDYDGQYSYRIAPVCLLQQMIAAKNMTGISYPISSNSYFKIGDFASPQVGWSYDGFPVYGPYGPYGIFMAPCNTTGANPDVCLDSCNGYYGKLPGIDDFMYRYYMSGEHGEGNCSTSVENAGDCPRNSDKCCTSTVPKTIFSPYSIGCYRGCLYKDGCTTSGERGYTSSYIPSVAKYPTEIAAHYSYPKISIKPILQEITTNLTPPLAPLVPIGDNQTQSFNVGQRLVAVRIPTNRSVVLATFSKNEKGMNSMQTEEIPSAKSDTFISDMVFDRSSSTIFYATESGIYSFDRNTLNIINQVVVGILEVEITGYNFGNSISDIYSVTVKGVTCTSLQRLNSENIKCVCVKSACTGNDVTTDDVVLSTIGGNTQGIYSQPYIILKSGTGRPVVSNIVLKKQPFIPNALSLVRKGINATLYWSNIGIGAYSIQRCQLDGSQLETISTGIQKGLGLHVISRDSNDIVFFTDASKSGLYRVSVARMTNQIFTSLPTQPIPLITGLQTPTDVYVEELSNFLFLSVLDGYLIRIQLDVALTIQPKPTNISAILPGNIYTIDIDLRNGRKSLPSWAKITVRGTSMSRYISSIVLPSCQCNFTTCPLSWNEQRIFISDTNQQQMTLSSDYGFPISSLNLFNGFPGGTSIVWPIAFSSKYDLDKPQICDEPIVLYVAEYLGKIWEVTIPRNKLTGIPNLDSLSNPILLFDRSNYVMSTKIRNILSTLPIQRKLGGPQLVFEMIS